MTSRIAIARIEGRGMSARRTCASRPERRRRLACPRGPKGAGPSRQKSLVRVDAAEARHRAAIGSLQLICERQEFSEGLTSVLNRLYRRTYIPLKPPKRAFGGNAISIS
jgi:hypothetical protein